jgi:hypothetical protein
MPGRAACICGSRKLSGSKGNARAPRLADGRLEPANRNVPFPLSAAHNGAMNRLAFTAAAIALVALGVPRRACASRATACVDSFGTVIQGIKSASACKKIGARWAKPGSKSLPKANDDSPRQKHHKKHRAIREAQG